MELMLKEIIHLIDECEDKKPLRESERIRYERKAYEDIKRVVEPFITKKHDRP